MKTAISVPDDTFDQAERRAAELGVSRSEFFTRAARHYLDELDARSLTTRIDAAIDIAGTDASSRAAVSAGHHLLAASEDQW
jgi:metal-responsive CopG/Arc/MetJ family transcriptional regulator